MHLGMMGFAGVQYWIRRRFVFRWVTSHISLLGKLAQWDDDSKTSLARLVHWTGPLDAEPPLRHAKRVTSGGANKRCRQV
jgi:hypothetical protein